MCNILDYWLFGICVYGKKILDGKDTNSTYSLTYATCGHLFFSETVSYETDSSNKGLNSR